MNTYDLIFSLNSSDRIAVNFQDPISEIHCCYSEPIFLFYNNKSIMLAKHPTYFNMRDLRDLLKKALNQELLLHKSIISDIGYLCNGYYYNELGFTTEDPGNRVQTWVGFRYYLWLSYENQKRYNTWIYNDHYGNVIFTVTPEYPYSLCDIRKKCHYITFKKWMLNYKPYLTVTLSHEKAQQWLDIAEHFINSVEENITRWEKEYKKD